MNKIKFLKKKVNNLTDGRETFEDNFSTISIITSLIFFDEWLTNGNLSSGFIEYTFLSDRNTSFIF